MLVLRCMAGGNRAKFTRLLKNKCTLSLPVLLRCEGGRCDKNERMDVIQAVWALPSVISHAGGPFQELEYQLLGRLSPIIKPLCR